MICWFFQEIGFQGKILLNFWLGSFEDIDCQITHIIIGDLFLLQLVSLLFLFQSNFKVMDKNAHKKNKIMKSKITRDYL